ncbi:MAG: FKBP-type peptidyl-prolyl cis-trans isomerase [bacterium]
MIQDGQLVSIEYTVKLESGEIADSNVGGDPLQYRQGASQILPELEQAIGQLDIGEQKEVTLTPEQGYGPHHAEAIQAVPVDQLPEEAREEGAQLVSRDAEGNEFPVRVQSIEGENATLDFNHPLAGETLQFDVKVVAID